MNDLRATLKVLGEENEKKLRDSITDMIIEQCQSDLAECQEYILYPPDFSDVFKTAYDQAIEEVNDLIKKKITEKIMKDLEKWDK